MENHVEAVKELIRILDQRAIWRYNVLVYDTEDTARIIHIASVCRLQLMEVDAIILHDDGTIQPDSGNDFILANRDIGAIRAKIGTLSDLYHFELLDLVDLHASAHEFLAEYSL